ncbi:MAG: bifunctional demethylmenaquinone methyltransferase/2-methoxy-6-polyprenyl-1,4-benzoquinol methylase UbiE [Desulfobulbaceae bacterium]|nr:MAG: bifunctional demethylmenaquinone methyltransferase/2-methoxy-6-polyprenyl-1,4-benzoquinol methylase UbiE [Desulfobulbaceae bacterium]
MSKAHGVKKMFDSIAARYDIMNRVMTLGQDQRWRRFAVDKANIPESGTVLDLACGTGDIAALVSQEYPSSYVVGADFSTNMLREAGRRFGQQISWLVCDANELPYKDDRFDAVTFGYLLRNVDDSLKVLREVYRVLKTGGMVVCLDTTPPEKNILYPFIRLHLHYGIPLLGKMIARDEDAYGYLIESTMDFHQAETLADIFKAAGFRGVGYKKFMMGTIGIHWGMK